MLECLKWYNFDEFFISNFVENNKNFYLLGGLVFTKDKKMKVNKLTSYQRIGPHNIDILSIIIGSVLGDTQLEKRSNGLGTRILFEQSNKNVEYLMWFHNYLSSRGYCNPNKPKLHTRIKKDNKVFYHYRINSYTFSSFNWLNEMFYSIDVKTDKLIKVVPLNIEKYLTPLALAIWFMEDGSKLGSGVRIATNNFTLEEVQFLCDVLYKKYNLTATAHVGGKNNSYVLYIHTKSVPLFSSLVKVYMHPSMYYKLGS
uniref:hypothetical protein n=1 Tax=Fuscoporia gilva TaxID=40471 RepID=UPI0023D86E33|nr:hypothetical protein P2X57_mgp26 [Fuscoporia gilva]WDD39639.1 hypothetical protein [Fuscoporia gilva]